MEKIEGLSIGLDLDSTALNRGLTGVKDKLKSVNSELKANLSAFDRGDRSIGKYETRLAGLNRKLEVQKEITKQAKIEYEKMVKEHGEGSKEADKAASSYNKEVAALNNIERYVGDVREELKRLKEEQRITSSGWTKAGDSLISFGDKLGSISGKIKETGKTLTTRLTVPIAGLVGTVATMGFKRAMDLEQVNFMLSTILDSEKEVESVMKGVSNLVTGTAFGLSEIANPVANLLASNASEKDALLHAEVSMELAALKGDDQLVPQLTDLIQKALLSGKVDGTMVNSFANAGIDILSVLGNKLGKSREVMRKALQDGSIDINDALRTMSEGILEGTEGLNGKTVAAGGMIEKSGETLSGKWKNFKASISQVGERMVTEHGIFDGVKNMLDEGRDLFKNSDEIFKSIFSGLGSALEIVVSLSINAVDWFKNLSDGTKNLMGTFVGFLALIGPLLVGLGLFGSVIANLALKLGPLFKSIAKAGGLLKWLKSGFIALTGPVGLTIGILALLGTGFILLYKNSETFRNGVHNLLGVIKDLAQKALKAIKPAIEAVITFFKDQLDNLKRFWNENGQIIMDALSNIGKIVKVVFGAIVKVIQLAMPLVLGIIKSVWINIKGVISGALNIIMGLVKVFSGLFTGDFRKMWEGIKQVFLGALTFIWNFVQLMFWGKMLKSILSLGKLLVNSFKGMWGSIKNVFSTVIKWIVDFVKKRFTMMKNTVNTITTTIKKLISTIWNGILDIIKLVIKSIVDLVKNRFTTLKNTINTIFSGIRNLTKTIWNAIKDSIYTPIKNAVTNTLSRFSNLKSSISGIFGTIKKNVKGYVSDMVNAVKGMPQKMADGISKGKTALANGAKKLGNGLISGVGWGVNKALDGIDWVLGKLGSKKRLGNWEVPQFAKGTPNGGHKGGLARIGDGNKHELVALPNGQMFISPNRDTLVNLPKGTEVLSGEKTSQLFGGRVPAFAKGTGGWLDNLVSGTKNAFNKVKDWGADIWDWVKDKSSIGKLLANKISSYGMGNLSGIPTELAKGSITKAIDAGKSMLFGEVGDSGGAAPAGKGVERWRNTVKKALARNKLPTSANYVNAWLRQIKSESGGNEKAIQSTAVKDVNYYSGNLARGLVQVIPPTFRAYAFPGHKNQMNGLDSLLAGMNYAKSRYGSNMLKYIGHGHGYATGGLINHAGMYNLAEDGWPEFVIPTNPSKRTDAMKLLALAGKTVDKGNKRPGQLPNVGTASVEGDNVLQKLLEATLEQTKVLLQLLSKNPNIILDGPSLAKGIHKEVTKYQTLEKRISKRSIKGKVRK
ncbi:tape measure protein [Peribacillus frigoritolerans]|uniref:tape measure protein n=1 Tax=Peribacillus frigoritolerans TaxID=450367 RepID=UPI00227FABB8|nr:tape measure protein [Peribacillus frigoritolerans]MCY9003275.1 tape measure protein [Peribacillus frigoritolerans]